MRIRFLVCLCALPWSLRAYSPPREPGVYLEATIGSGDFLYHLGEEKPKFSRFNEVGAAIHGMSAAKSDGGLRYGLGLSFNREWIDQKVCAPAECPDPRAERDRSRTSVLSPFGRLEWPTSGLLAGVSLTGLGIPLPRFALRLGPADFLYGTFEFLNGESFLAEGLVKAGLGGRFKATEAWIGGDLLPFHGVGISARAAQLLGPLRVILGGRIGRATVRYVDSESDDPPINAGRMEFAGTAGLEFRSPF
jgi:hypothetical protein